MEPFYYEDLEFIAVVSIVILVCAGLGAGIIVIIDKLFPTSSLD